MRGFQEHVVGGSCSIAVRDYGGTGRPLLLLHGATRNLCDWTPVAELLSGEHRVVSMDLRGHGHSDVKAWHWGEVLEDVRRVVDATGLGRPALVGHSLGGMVAALYSASGGPASAVVNLDGFGPGRPDQYIGMPPEAVLRFRDEGIRTALAAGPDTSGPLASTDVRTVRAAALATATKYDIPAEWEVQTFDRSVRRFSDDAFVIAPSAGYLATVMAAVAATDWFDVFRRVSAPFVIYKALVAVASGLGIERESELVAAYRQGLLRDLAALAADSPNVRVRRVDTNHGLILTMPDILAQEIHQLIESAV